MKIHINAEMAKNHADNYYLKQTEEIKNLIKNTSLKGNYSLNVFHEELKEDTIKELEKLGFKVEPINNICSSDVFYKIYWK